MKKPNDKTKVDEYLDAIRELERRIQKAEEQSALELPTIAKPVGAPTGYEEHGRLMFDLLALAYQADLTRISSFMMGRELSVPMPVANLVEQISIQIGNRLMAVHQIES